MQILLVDDRPANLLVLRAILDDLGHPIVESHSGEDALAKLHEMDFAVVLLDIQMPGLNGFETARRIRGRPHPPRHTPIIFLSADESPEFSAVDAYSLGAVDFLIKPFIPEILRAKVKELVGLLEQTRIAQLQAEQLRLLIDGTKEYAIIMLDPQGQVMTWNPGAERIKGYRAAEIVGESFERFYAPEDLEAGKPRRALEVATASGKFEEEGWRTRKDGTRFWASVVITALYDAAGNVRGYSKMTRDVTERRKAEATARRLLQEEAARRAAEASTLEAQRAQREERRQREELFVTLNSIGDAVIVTDGTGIVKFLNPVAQKLTGWQSQEGAGRPLEEVFRIVNEDTRQTVESPVRRVIREGAVVGLANHTLLIAKDGRERPIDDSAAPIRGEGDALFGVVLVFRDVTEQRRTERAIRESDARKAAILNTALDAIITIDGRGRIIDFNPAAERTFGKPLSEVAGTELAELIIPPRFREQHRRGLAHYAATGEAPVLGKRLEMSAIGADGVEFPVELAISQISTEGPPLFTGYIRDLSERSRTERYRNARLAFTEALAQATTIQAAASSVLAAVCKSLAWDIGDIWFLDRQADVLRFVDCWHKPSASLDAFAAMCRQRTFTRGEGLPGRIWSSGKAASIPDVLLDSNFPRAPFADKAGLHGAFGSPIQLSGEFMGIMEFFSHEIRQPDPDLLEMMTTMCEQFGQFVKRARTEEKLREADRLKDEFLAMLAHELRNPLAPIRSALNVINLRGDAR
ncbi:MAG: PAS domain S-box protein, partial [Pirellulales bacterium]